MFLSHIRLCGHLNKDWVISTPKWLDYFLELSKSPSPVTLFLGWED